MCAWHTLIAMSNVPLCVRWVCSKSQHIGRIWCKRKETCSGCSLTANSRNCNILLLEKKKMAAEKGLHLKQSWRNAINSSLFYENLQLCARSLWVAGSWDWPGPVMWTCSREHELLSFPMWLYCTSLSATAPWVGSVSPPGLLSPVLCVGRSHLCQG